MADVVEQVAVVAFGSGFGAIYNALRDIVGTVWDVLPPPSEIEVPFVVGPYEMTAVGFELTLPDGAGGTASFGPFAHFLFTQWMEGPSMRERMRDVRVAAISEGVVVASTISIPELLQPLFGEEIDCYRHVGNGTRFVLTTALPFMPHEFAGVDADITDLAA